MKLFPLKGMLSSAAAIASLTILSSLSPAEAASFTFDAAQFTGANAKVSVTLDDQAAGEGKIQFSVKMAANSPTIGDIRGIFFNIADTSLLSGLKIQGPHITATATSTAGTLSSVGKVNLNGDGGAHSFNIGVEIGDNGLKGGKDDIQTTTFTLSHTSAKLDLSLFAQQAFGVRLTSVGTGNNRELSSKLVGTSPVLPPVSITPPPSNPNPAPAPSPNPAPPPPSNPAPPPVVIAPLPTPGPVPETPAQPNNPVEVPEPGTMAALLMATAGGVKLLKRKNAAQDTMNCQL